MRTTAQAIGTHDPGAHPLKGGAHLRVRMRTLYARTEVHDPPRRGTHPGFGAGGACPSFWGPLMETHWLFNPPRRRKWLIRMA